MTGVRHLVRRTVCAAAAVLVLTPIGAATADPAADGVAKLNELSRQAVESRKAVTAAQRDVDATQAEEAAAADRHRADLEALEVANAQLQPFQAAVDRVAAMTYMSRSTGRVAAVLTAGSPQELIDQLTVQRAVVDGAADKMEAYRSARERAAEAAGASERSAADARTAAERASAVREDLQTKLRALLRQIAEAEAQYGALTPQQQAVVNNAAAVMPGATADIPESLPVGVANEVGLQPNTILAARAVSAQFPQIAEIGGVRPDSLPWHPSGLAIDIMIPNSGSAEGIALGNEIMAFALSNAARFGLQDVIWRGTYYTPSGPQGSGYGHFDHVHITTTPRH
ncbi:glycoside hydrolase [Mycolicibacterium boenickei]|uniref:Glycoside hydrolase n=1 Tax=Mycolicibacterium boenickei TaxID=146017 RepID=A0AAX3A6F3_9MYCO|nr:glycoside hydrolase [Mycolicibacterium boenickei]PEG61748.1 glycoside hydrolase [Mycolicibacterium boenickei]UNC02738.1 glycoside hydrolase [Mycolicibacterium boenickei]BBX90013.1 glycoside hydrolase [Mycolicibacterium boenickei]